MVRIISAVYGRNRIWCKSVIASYHETLNDFPYPRRLGRYVCSATSGVSDAIGLYTAAFEGDAAYAPPPLPPYLAGKEEDLDALDTAFLLLRLFQDKSSVKLERLLAPVSHTPLPLDSRVRFVGNDERGKEI